MELYKIYINDRNYSSWEVFEMNSFKKVDIAIDPCESKLFSNDVFSFTNEKKMDKILELLEKDCKKMSDHIDFVENVYDNVKMPFYYVMNKVNYLVSSDNKGILDSEHNNEKRLL